MASDDRVQHLLRRAGFGASAAELASYSELGFDRAVDSLVNYERVPDTVDANIGKSSYVSVTSRGQFSPNTNLNDARQRWLFRMIHSQRPLQEKMTLFWHNHFATAFSKVAGAYPAADAVRMLAAKASEDAAQQKGQIEMLRENALGNFRDLLIAVSKDPAMLVFLDGRLNTKDKPQENFAREIMELFTMGVGFYTESDVYAGAKVFSGWNLRATRPAGDQAAKYEFLYAAPQHDTSAKTFSFAIDADGSKTIPARSSSDGMQDGVDLISALARHPETGRYLARKLIRFFVSELSDPDDGFVNGLAGVYQSSGFDMREVVRRLLLSGEFSDPGATFARYAWPVELVVRAIKEIGWTGFSVNEALTPLANMGQQLYEPPDVSGWNLGQGWFSTGATLARMNFAATLTANQKFNLRDQSRSAGKTAPGLLSYFLDRLPAAPLEAGVYSELLNYLNASGAWTGSDTQLLAKAPGLAHLIAGMSEYQFV